LNVGRISAPAALRTPKRHRRQHLETGQARPGKRFQVLGVSTPKPETPGRPNRRRAASASALRVVISHRPPRTTMKDSSRMR